MAGARRRPRRLRVRAAVGEFASAGSVYAFVGEALGPRAGFVTGWALLGTYLVFPAVSISAVAVFGQAFLASTGIAAHAPWLPLALAAGRSSGCIASRDIARAARTLLLFEVVSVALILVLMAIIVVHARRRRRAGRPAASPRRLLACRRGRRCRPSALASTFGFLSFAGFESAGSLGEEADRPRA